LPGKKKRGEIKKGTRWEKEEASGQKKRVEGEGVSSWGEGDIRETRVIAKRTS